MSLQLNNLTFETVVVVAIDTGVVMSRKWS